MVDIKTKQQRRSGALPLRQMVFVMRQHAALFGNNLMSTIQDCQICPGQRLSSICQPEDFLNPI